MQEKRPLFYRFMQDVLHGGDGGLPAWAMQDEITLHVRGVLTEIFITGASGKR